MAITLQTVLPQKVLPRAPSLNASSPNPGIRSAITQFIPASPDTSFEQNSPATPAQESSGSQSRKLTLTRANSSISQDQHDASSATPRLKSPGLGPMDGRKSMSAGAGSRRGIAHSSRILGRDKDTQEAFALSQLTNGKVDVSFEGTLGSGRTLSHSGKGKAKARDGDADVDESVQTPLFDIDLESGQPTASSSSNTSRAGRLLQMGSHSMPWSKGKGKAGPVPAYQGSSAVDTPSTDAPPPAGDSRDDSLDFHRPAAASKADYSADADADDDYRAELGAFDDDREQLLHAGAGDDAGRPGYFAPGDRSFGYNALGSSGPGLGGYGGAVGFETMTLREGGWMVLSSISVGVLVTVAILISIDVIDWPGDGIGRY